MTAQENGSRAAIYVRLSREDHQAGESGSIAAQRELVGAFLREQTDLCISAVFADDGWSGSNFDRPGFCRMMDAIRAGEIDCVAVKDLSRFGRNYMEVGRYIEELFPLLGVRFIAVCDHYDSAHARTGVDRMLMPFQNLLNDAFCRDGSVKIKSQLAVKRRAGEFVGAFAPYGYRQTAESPRHLVPDGAAAETVRLIFQWKLEGQNHAAIVQKLNASGILSPAAYKREQGSAYRSGYEKGENTGWNVSTVARILSDERYTGTLVQGKSERPDFRLARRTVKPKEDWIRIENAQEGLVTRADFETAARLAKLDTRTPEGRESLYPLSGLITCADCGWSMIHKRVHAKGKDYLYATCAQNKADKKACTPHRIDAGLLEQAVTAVLDLFGGETRVLSRGCAVRRIERILVCEGGRVVIKLLAVPRG